VQAPAGGFGADGVGGEHVSCQSSERSRGRGFVEGGDGTSGGA
jgi:hypothetical protein